jgi:hypothetical protein
LIVNWNGSSWQTVSSPNPSSTSNILSGVSVVNSTNVWASGVYDDDSSGAHVELLLRWNGTSWATVSGAGPSTAPTLQKIAAVSANDIWTVGAYNDTGLHYATLTEHWNGTAWSHVSSPNATGQNSLRGVVPVESTYVWAVGYAGSRTLIELWDGTEWSIVTSPNQGTGSNSLYAVSVETGSSIISGFNAWAVGFYHDPSTGLKKTLAMSFTHPGSASP